MLLISDAMANLSEKTLKKLKTKTNYNIQK